MKNTELEKSVFAYSENQERINILKKENSAIMERLVERARYVFRLLKQSGLRIDGISDVDKIEINNETLRFSEYWDGDYDVGSICVGTEILEVPTSVLYDDDELERIKGELLQRQKAYDDFLNEMRNEHEREEYERLKLKFGEN